MTHASRLLPLTLLVAACAALISTASAPTAHADDRDHGDKPRLMVLPFAVSGWDSRLGDGIAAQLDEWDVLHDRYTLVSRTDVNATIRDLGWWIEDATTASHQLCDKLDAWLVLEGSIDKISDAHVLLSARLIEVDPKGGMTVLASGASETGAFRMSALRELVESVLNDVASGASQTQEITEARATVTMTLPSAFANEAVHVDLAALTADLSVALEDVAPLLPRFQFQVDLTFPEDRISSMFGVVIMCACVATCDVVSRESGRVVDSFVVVDELGETFEIAAARIASTLPGGLVEHVKQRFADELSDEARMTVGCEMPGTWYARPRGADDSQWREVGVTPGEFSVVVSAELGFVVAESASAADVVALIELPSLIALNLQACGVTDEAVDALARCVSLQALLISGPISDIGLGQLLELRNLTMLELYDCDNVTDNGIALLAELPRLDVLSLPHCDGFNGMGLDGLNGTTVSNLTLFGCAGLSDDALSTLKNWPNLRTVDLENSAWLTDAGLAHLADVPALSRVDLEACNGITDAGIAALAGLESLRTLDLSNCEGLQAPTLSRLHALRALDLSNCANLTGVQFDDSLNLEVLFMRGCANLGIEALDAIASLVLLRTLDLTGCANLTEDDIEALRTRLPACSITF